MAVNDDDATSSAADEGEDRSRADARGERDGSNLAEHDAPPHRRVQQVDKRGDEPDEAGVVLGMPYSQCCAAPEEVVVVVPGRARLPDDALEDGREGHDRHRARDEPDVARRSCSQCATLYSSMPPTRFLFVFESFIRMAMYIGGIADSTIPISRAYMRGPWY